MTDLARLGSAMRDQDVPRDLVIARLAKRQHTVVHHRQLRAIGLSKASIHRREKAGRLHRLYRGVYAVGHRVVPREGWHMAAVLACGPGAVLSHESAAVHWGLLRPRTSVVDVTTLRGRGGAQRGIRLHRIRQLDSRDWIVLNNIRVTTIPRTLLDLAEVVDRFRLRRAAEAADRQGRLDVSAVEALCARSPGRRGLKPLRDLLSDSVIEPATRSDPEALFLDLIANGGLPRPQVNVLVEDFEVDFYWPNQRLIVEIDSYAYHRTPQAFERDRARDVCLKLADQDVLRFTDRQLTREPEAVLAAVRRALAGRDASCRRSPPRARGRRS